jgi:hypothetical protein
MANFTDYLAEAHQVFDEAREEYHRKGFDFLTTELSLSRSFAERALAAFSQGDVQKAKQSVMRAKAAYRAVQRFLPKVPLEHDQRGMIIGEFGAIDAVAPTTRCNQISPFTVFSPAETRSSPAACNPYS